MAFIKQENIRKQNTGPNCMSSRSVQWIAMLIFFLACYSTDAQQKYPKQEFRAVWIASVANIDWPSKPGLSAEEQQNEFLNIIKMHKANGLNAVIVQVRPAADAFYPSRY